MEKFTFNKYVVKPTKKTSILEDIQAKDIYTVHSPASGPTLPNVDRSLSFYQQYENNRLMAAGNVDALLPDCIPDMLNSQMDSLYVVFEDEIVDRQPKIKKLSIGTYQNLPAVMEEDIELDSSMLLRQPKMAGVGSSTGTSQISGETDGLCYSTNREEDYYENYNKDELLLDDEESWVDLSKHSSTPPRLGGSGTNPQTFLNGEEYLRLLREAQKESNQSSARASLASSRRDTPRDTPRSPPNSPNTELVLNCEDVPVKEVLINYYNNEGDFIRVEKKTETDWLWHWSSRPDQEPPKDWNFTHSTNTKVSGRGVSLRKLMVGNSSIFSRDVLYTMIITNVLSLLVGTGIGILLSKRSGSNVAINTIPLN